MDYGSVNKLSIAVKFLDDQWVRQASAINLIYGGVKRFNQEEENRLLKTRRARGLNNF